MCVCVRFCVANLFKYIAKLSGHLNIAQAVDRKTETDTHEQSEQ